MTISARNNRTLNCTEEEFRALRRKTISLKTPCPATRIKGGIINQDFFDACRCLPRRFVDLLILDPPYNISKNYNGNIFKARDASEYRRWFGDVVSLLMPALKDNATVYVCGDWKTSAIIFPVLEEYFAIRNRITWEREKGRGAKANWKNCSEDIWFCTVGGDFFFDVDAVKMKKKVLAPYKNVDGQPKDWSNGSEGKYRLTHPSNLWTDITVPFWSMRENTAHPTQKPEKLIAKLIMASSKKGDFVFDPFLGSGTTAVVAKKLGRNFAGIEIDPEYCCLALKRLAEAEDEPSIQGYDGVFWERNSAGNRKKPRFSKDGKILEKQERQMALTRWRTPSTLKL